MFKKSEGKLGLAILVVDSFNEVHVFHQVHILGPNLLFPAERIMALSGHEFPTPGYRLNSNYMFANIEVPVPDWDQMKKAQDVASVKSLEVSNRIPPMLKSKNVLAVPPLVVSSIMKSKSTDPVKLLIVLLETIETYDKDSRDPKVSETLRKVAEFLWAASTDNIIPISFSPDNSEGGKKWAISLHSSTFPALKFVNNTSSTTQDQTNQDVWDRLSEALKTLPDNQLKSSLGDATMTDAKKDSVNGWDKVSEVLQQMIIKLSSTNNECFPSGPAATYLQILKQSKALGVAMVLNVILSTMGCYVEVTASMANAIRTGNFRANSLLVAHSFSIFNIPYSDAALMTNFNQTQLIINSRIKRIILVRVALYSRLHLRSLLPSSSRTTYNQI
jgi:hypothetical protein